MKKLLFLFVVLLTVCAGQLAAQMPGAGGSPVRITFEMSTCHNFTVDANGVLMQEERLPASDYRITFEPDTHRWGESTRKEGQSVYTSRVSRLKPEVRVTHRGNDIRMRLADRHGREILLDGDGRIYVYDTEKAGRVYTDTEGQNFLTLTDADGRTMAKNYILGLRDMFRRLSDYYQVRETKEHLTF